MEERARWSIPPKQRRYYCGKNKRHTQKVQLMVGAGHIYCVQVAKGRKHDLRLFKESKVRLHAANCLQGHRGYQGLPHLHAHSWLPHKGHKNKAFNKEQKQQNRQLAVQPVVVEHTIGKLKVFRILSQRYRNRRKRFGLRVNLIAGILNYELQP